jgi:hypothetical protein
MTSVARLVSEECAGAGWGDPEVIDVRRTRELVIKSRWDANALPIYKREKAAGMREAVQQRRSLIERYNNSMAGGPMRSL